jgi:hypothetical protein
MLRDLKVNDNTEHASRVLVTGSDRTLRGAVRELPSRRDHAVSPQRHRPYDHWRDAQDTS